MSGGGGSKTTTQTTGTQLPAWAEAAGADTWGRAQKVADRPYEAYSGDVVAGMTPDQLQAAQTVRNVQGQADPTFAQSQGIASNLGQGARITTTDQMNQMTRELYNPYQEQVIDTSLANLRDETSRERNRMGAAAHQAGAFGGDRFGVAEGVLGAESAQAAGTLAAQLRAQGYSQAQAQAMALEQANQARAMAGLSLAPQLAAQRTGLALSEAGALGQVGQQFQQQNQLELQDDYRRWLEERSYPAEMVGFLTGTLNGIPMGGTTTATQGNSRNQMAGIAGGALSGAAMGTAINPGIGTAIGAVGGGILGAFA